MSIPDAFRRPEFSPDGRIVARRELTMGEIVYRPGQELSAADRATLSARQVGAWYGQGLIDTLPPLAVQPSSRPAPPQRR